MQILQNTKGIGLKFEKTIKHYIYYKNMTNEYLLGIKETAKILGATQQTLKKIDNIIKNK